MKAATPRSLVVLLLQPEHDDKAMYAEFFRYAGVITLCPNNVLDALSLAPKADVVVTGMLLPGQMDGVEFITRLRRADETKHIPVIVLTACAWASERQRAEHAGCDLFLPKPCLPDDLLRHIRRVVTSTKARIARPARPVRRSVISAEMHDRSHKPPRRDRK